MTIKSTINARVITNKPLSAQGGSASGGQKGKACKYFRMALALNKPIKKVVPGQFVHINLNSNEHFAAQAGEVTARLSQRLNASEHILPRPFTIYDVKQSGRVIEVVYQVVGQGTELMSHIKTNERVSVLCPLGNGFKIDKKARMSILVAGGIGLAGLYLLLKQMTAQRIKNIYIFIGSRSKDDLCLLPEFRKLSDNIVVATEDGSLGTKGLITAALDKFLNRSILHTSYSILTIYSCGPAGMSEAVRELAVSKNIPCQISLEARMGCGVGLCRVCVCPVRSPSCQRHDGSRLGRLTSNGVGKTTKGYATVCEDGPVFSAKDLA